MKFHHKALLKVMSKNPELGKDMNRLHKMPLLVRKKESQLWNLRFSRQLQKQDKDLMLFQEIVRPNKGIEEFIYKELYTKCAR